MGVSTLPKALQAQSLEVVTALNARPAVAGNDRINEPPLVLAARQLVQLNYQYLGLSAFPRRFPNAIAIRLTALSQEQRLAIADCHFSLFSLGLSDAHRWLPLLSGSAPAAPQDIAPCHDAMSGEFVTTALFFAWHLVQSDPLAAKVLLDVDAQVAGALRCASIASLRAVSARALDWLAPRWLHHPYFWSALLRHSDGRHSDGRKSNELAATKLLGRQLLAAESLEIAD